MKYSKRKKITQDLQAKIEKQKSVIVQTRLSLTEYDKAMTLAAKYDCKTISAWLRLAATTPIK